MFKKVLVANRGEIAVRIIRACEELGIATVAVYSELDRDAIHVKRADEAFLLGPGPASESYLAIDKLIDAVERSGAEAVHPGYGFLAENASFAAALEKHGITFIGPPASAIEAMGSKTRARELMREAGVPIVPGTTEPVETLDDARKVIEETIGYPVAVKAAGGGGGKGFRVALDESKLKDAFEGAGREGEKFFGDSTVYLERYLPDPRHVEVQVLADTHGNVIHLGERDCSLQRRHQKLIEEAPAPAVDEKLRAKIGKIATEAAAAVSYTGAGTIEGLLQEGEYFFLEMNTRVQVEHCVTEMVTGIDIVKEGIRVAAGEPLSIKQKDLELRGHAIECRINAEDASKNFAPAPGPDRRIPGAGGTRRPGRLRGRSRRRDLAHVRPDGGQADRVGRRPRAGHQTDGPGAARVRDRGPEDAPPLPRGDPPDRAVGERRDLPGPDRGPQVAEAARRTRGRAAREGGGGGRAELHGRGVGQALRRQGHRPAVRRRWWRAAVPRPSTAPPRRPAAHRARPGAPDAREAAPAAAATRSPPRSRARF